MIQIQVKNVFSGVHYYANAPEEVSFLRNPHRHQFVVRTTLEVFNEDRELEFLLVKKAIYDYIMKEMGKDGSIDLGGHSCEWLALKIAQFIQFKYGCHRQISVGVYEDDENGAIVTLR